MRFIHISYMYLIQFIRAWLVKHKLLKTLPPSGVYHTKFDIRSSINTEHHFDISYPKSYYDKQQISLVAYFYSRAPMNTSERSCDYIFYKISPFVQEEKFLINFVNVLLQFCYYLPMLKVVACVWKNFHLKCSIWTNSNPLYPRISPWRKEGPSFE